MVGTFTTNNDNKNALNEYLAKKLIDLHQGSKLIITTFKNSVLCSSNTDIDTSEVGVHSCQSEEADQRLVRHLLNCICGNKKYSLIVIRTIDTDVMILVVAYVSEYQNMCSNTKVYVFMVNSNKMYDICAIVKFLRIYICHALPFFYAVTGNDIVSFLYGQGKCKAWEIWLNCDDNHQLTNLFQRLGDKPLGISEEDFGKLEEFVLEVYSMRQCSPLAEACGEIFRTSPNSNLWKLPPGKDALMLRPLTTYNSIFS